MKACSSLEALEGRIAPATLLIPGTAANDLLTVIATGGDSGTYQLNDGPIVSFSGVSKFEFYGGDGDDTLTIVNPAGSVFAPAEGIDYDGQAHSTPTGDSLVLSGGGGAGFGETWILGATPDRGTIILSDGNVSQVIRYAGLEPVTDLVVAASFTVTGTNAANAISYTVGTASNRGLVAVDNNETIEFANKGTLFINAGGGDDTITLNNANLPAGLASIVIDAGDGVDRVVVETAGSADTAVFTGTSSNSATLALTSLGLSTSLSRIENVVYRNTDSSGLDNLTITGSFNDRIDYDAATFAGSYRSILSPAFDFVLVGRLTVNPGLGDFDVVNITGSAGDDFVTSTGSAITVTTPGTTAIVTLGAGIDRVNLFTGDGNDNIDLDLSLSGLRKVVDAGTGNDTVNLINTTTGTVFGGEGDDFITGSTTADLIYGGPGNDILVGGGGDDVEYGEEGNDILGNPSGTANGVADDPGNDQFFGGAGSDRFFWEPGDGDDLIEGGAGDSDELSFFGNAGAEQFFLFADTAKPSRLHLFRLQAAIDIDAADLEEVNFIPQGGADSVAIGRSDLGVLSDLSTTGLRVADVSLGTDAVSDNVTFEGRPADDNLLINVASGFVKAAGLGYDLRIDGSDPALDRLTVNGNEGDDRVVANPGVEAAIAITLLGGTGNDFLSGSGILNGNDGDDTLVSGLGASSTDGGAGDDRFFGNGGTVAVGGGVGSSVGDTIVIKGTEGADTITLALNASGHLLATVNGLTTTFTNFIGGLIATSGVEGVDVLALGGNDRVDLSAYSGIPARVLGGDGDDVLIGGPEDDFLDGGAGSDVLRGGGGQDTLLNNGTFGFTAPAALEVGTAPKGTLAADLNGDLLPDLVVVNSVSRTVSVLLGTASGLFQDPVDFASGGTLPTSVAVGDFNSDGKADLAVANAGSRTIAIFLGNGSGAFPEPPTLFSTGKKPVDLHAADLNNDTKLDLVFLAGSGVSTLTGAGDGTFSGLLNTATGGIKPVALAIADFNLDGFADVVTANNGSNNVSLLTGTGTGFNPALKFKTGFKPNAVATGDLDGDGALDLVVTNTGSRFVSVLLGNGGALGSQFDRQLKVAAPGVVAPAAVGVADLNGDGFLDFVITNAGNGSFSVVLGRGNGFFTLPVVFSLGGDPKMKAGALAIGDFNRDGAPDLAIVGTGSADISIALALAG